MSSKVVKYKSTRKSYGIACCRYNDKNKLEILLIQKRYTYSFASFVFGQYKKKDSGRLISLFNGMTIQEKLDIMSLRFDIMWYRLWAIYPDVETLKIWGGGLLSKKSLKNHDIDVNNMGSSRYNFYLKKKIKFEKSFLHDKGARLKKLISNTKNSEVIWEIPKGRKNKNESPLDCSIREFKEETRIGIEDYTLIFNIRPIRETYIASNTEYIHQYQIAYMYKKITPNIQINSFPQISEISDIRWIGLDEIKYIDKRGYLYKFVRYIFSIFNSKYAKCS